MTKILMIILVLFSFIGCDTSSHSEKSNSENKSLMKENSLFSSLTRTNGIFHKEEIDENLVLVFDTITSANYCNWININAKSIKGYFKVKGDFKSNNYKYLRPSRIFIKGEEKQNGLYQLGDKKFILAMKCEEEITNYVNWVEVEKDSVMFISCITQQFSLWV